MNRIYVLVILLILYNNSFAQKVYHSRLVCHRTDYYNTQTNTIYGSDSTRFIYRNKVDSFFMLNGEKIWKWDTSSYYDNGSLQTSTLHGFDNRGMLIYEIAFNSFDSIAKTLWFYTPNNDLDSFVTLYKRNGVWESRYTYKYKWTNHQMVEYTNIAYDNFGTVVKHDLYKYSYSGKNLSEVIETDILYNKIVLHKYQYNGNGQITEEDFQKYNGIIYEDYQRILYTYSLNNDLLTEQTEYYSGTQFEDGGKNVYAYSNNHTKLSMTNYEAKEVNPNFKNIYEYDSLGNMITEIVYNWDNSTNSFKNPFGRNIYRYEVYKIDNLNIIGSVSNNSITLFPNPASGVLNINIQRMLSSSVSFDIYNVSGGRFMHWADANKNPHTLSIDIYNLPAGMYILKCTGGEYSMQSFQVVK